MEYTPDQLRAPVTRLSRSESFPSPTPFHLVDLSFQYDNHRRRQWHPTPVLLPGKSHGWKNLVGRSPWGREESDMTARLHFHFSLSCIREGNGNPLQCSCLESPRDGGVWWAAVSGVAQSRTRLTRLSSSSMITVDVSGGHETYTLFKEEDRGKSQSQEERQK